MKVPKLTIGMATFDDFDGVYFTIQALRLYHDLREVELIVVDNKPDSAGSASIRHVLGQAKAGTAGARYIAAPEIVGTSARATESLPRPPAMRCCASTRMCCSRRRPRTIVKLVWRAP